MGTIKTTNIEPIADNGTVTLGSSGDTFTLGSGVKQSNMLYPSWNVYLSADVTGITDNVYTKVEFDTELYDTDNMYDNSTNYRVTIPTGKAGKYMVQSQVLSNSLAVNNSYRNRTAIYKNGSLFAYSFFDFRNNPVQQCSPAVSCIMDLAVNDYIEIFAIVDSVSGGTVEFRGEPPSTGLESWFQGYRIGS